MPSRSRTFSLLALLGLFCALQGQPAWVQAQKKLEDSPGRLPTDGSDKLKKQYQDKGGDFRDLAKGERPATKADAELIDLGAKYFVYRLTWREETSKPGSATLLINQAEVILNSALNSKGKASAFLEMFGRQMGIRIKELLSHDDLLVRVNAALMLSVAARTGNPELAPLLTEVIRDANQAEAVRYWAVGAAHDLFSHTRKNNLKMRPDQEEPCIAALLEYLQRGPDFPDRIARIQRDLADPNKRETVSDDDKKDLTQYEGGVQMARRQAVRALGETRHPALMKRGDGRAVPDEKGLTALALVQIVAGDTQAFSGPAGKKAKGLPPRVSLGEQVEAAIGICQLQSTLASDYCPDYAAHHLGRFLVEFANRSNNERGDKLEPWRNYAGRLLAALEELANDMKRRSPNDPGTKYVTGLLGHATQAVKGVEAGAQAGTDNLLRWLGATELPNKSVYKNMEKTVVKPANPDM